jgi:dipeptidyl aminopeptidase/acylaminoacyl peptidase
MSLLRIAAVAVLALSALSAFAAEGKRPLTVEDLWKVKRLGPPSLSPDGQWVAVEVTTFDMEKDDSTSDVWLLSTDGKTQKQLTNAPGKDSGPRWSPDGKKIAFLARRGSDEGNQVYLISPDGGEARRLTDMPAAPSALKWGADGKTLYCVAWTWPDTPDDESYRKKDKEQKDSKVKAFVIDDAMFRYWDKWIADGKRPVVFAIDVATGKHKNLFAGLKLFLPPTEPSASDFDVSPDGKELAFVADSAKDPGTDVNLDIYALSLEKPGEPKNLTADNPANDGSPAYSPDGKKVAFLRQTTKYFYADRSRVMVMDRAGGKPVEVTAELDRSCGSPRWDGNGQNIYCEVEDAGYQKVYGCMRSGAVDSATVLVPLTQGATDRSLDLATADGKTRLAFLRTSFDRPPEVWVQDGRGEPRRIDKFNDDLTAAWQLGEVKNMTFKGADGDDVQMWVLYPPQFDPKKKWPLVQIVHGGPHNGITTDFSFRWNPQLWAAQGYVVGVVNFHGSSGFGQKFTDSITGDLGTKPMADVMKATDWFVEQPWIDKDRLAAAGGSYGGYMMAWLNGHTDRFKAMVCHAGVYNWHSMMASDIIKARERSLGAPPWGEMDKIDKQSAQRYAANFKTPTLVVHGEKDYRVPVTQGLEYYNTLRQKGVPARLLYYPDENHWVLKPQNSRLWHKEVFGWLEKYVGKGPTP